MRRHLIKPNRPRLPAMTKEQERLRSRVKQAPRPTGKGAGRPSAPMMHRRRRQAYRPGGTPGGPTANLRPARRNRRNDIRNPRLKWMPTPEARDRRDPQRVLALGSQRLLPPGRSARPALVLRGRERQPSPPPRLPLLRRARPRLRPSSPMGSAGAGLQAIRRQPGKRRPRAINRPFPRRCPERSLQAHRRAVRRSSRGHRPRGPQVPRGDWSSCPRHALAAPLHLHCGLR